MRPHRRTGRTGRTEQTEQNNKWEKRSTNAKVNFPIGCRLPTPPLDDIGTCNKNKVNSIN